MGRAGSANIYFVRSIIIVICILTGNVTNLQITLMQVCLLATSNKYSFSLVVILLYTTQEKDLQQAEKFADSAISLDRYNPHGARFQAYASSVLS